MTDFTTPSQTTSTTPAPEAKKKKPWYLRWWAIALAAIVLIVIGTNIANGGKDDGNTTTTPPSTPASPGATSEPGEPSTPADPHSQAVAWAEQQFGTFTEVVHEGRGDSVITLPEGATAGLVIAEYNGSGHFAISGLDAQNESTAELLVNTIGAYTGVTIWGQSALGEAVRLEVSANSAWKITFAPVASAPALAESGTGDAVFLYSGPASTLTLTTTSRGHVALVQDTGASFEWGLLINETGPYSGTVAIKSGPSLLELTAPNAWTIATG